MNKEAGDQLQMLGVVGEVGAPLHKFGGMKGGRQAPSATHQQTLGIDRKITLESQYRDHEMGEQQMLLKIDNVHIPSPMSH